MMTPGAGYSPTTISGFEPARACARQTLHVGHLAPNRCLAFIAGLVFTAQNIYQFESIALSPPKCDHVANFGVGPDSAIPAYIVIVLVGIIVKYTAYFY